MTPCCVYHLASGAREYRIFDFFMACQTSFFSFSFVSFHVDRDRARSSRSTRLLSVSASVVVDFLFACHRLRFGSSFGMMSIAFPVWTYLLVQQQAVVVVVRGFSPFCLMILPCRASSVRSCWCLREYCHLISACMYCP